MSRAETPCAQVLSASIRLFKRYRRKTGLCEAETDTVVAVFEGLGSGRSEAVLDSSQPLVFLQGFLNLKKVTGQVQAWSTVRIGPFRLIISLSRRV